MISARVKDKIIPLVLIIDVTFVKLPIFVMLYFHHCDDKYIGEPKQTSWCSAQLTSTVKNRKAPFSSFDLSCQDKNFYFETRINVIAI